MKGQFTKYDTVIKYNISSEQKDAICTVLLEYYERNCHFGEGIMQDDDSLIEAPDVLANICDNIIKFEEGEEDR